VTTDTFVPDAPPVDPAEAHALLSSLMRRYQRHEKALQIILASEKAQLAEIMEFEKERADTERAELAELERQMRPLAAVLLPFDPEKRKTVSTVAGDVQFHAGSTSIEVEDADAYLQWAIPRDHTVRDGYNWHRPPVPSPPAPDLVGIKHAIANGYAVVNDDGSLSLKGDDGERLPIPGVRQVKGEETFSVKPR
jgi:hypothetical protein